ARIQKVEIDPAGEAVVKGTGEYLEVFGLTPVLGLHRRSVPTTDHRGIRLLQKRKKLFESGLLLSSSYRNDLYLTVFTKKGFIRLTAHK
ncbi:MAG: hypothetical protein OXL96_24665, partial [Candidatus Poribacteria bacterium]|nr:hypothetical protein [Candidatus Poribacteria bacterium]